MIVSGLLLFNIFLIFGTYAVEKDGNVLIFTDANFHTEIAKHNVILVEFYAPWCGHCKRLAPEYATAATKLFAKDQSVALAKVDCTVEKSTCSKYGVSGYPTLKIFKNGEFSKEYDGPREADGIIRKMMKEAGPVSKTLETAAAAKKFLDTSDIAVIGYFKNDESYLKKAHMKAADALPDVKFAHTLADEVKEEMKVSESKVVLYRPKRLQSKFEDHIVECTDSAKLKDCLEEAAIGLAGERTQDNAEVFKKPLFVAYFNIDYVKDTKGTNYWRNRVMKVGKKIQDEGEKAFFAISNSEAMSRELEECGLEAGNKPVVCAWDSKGKKYKMAESFGMDTFEQFIRDVLAGKVEVHLKSEPIPETNPDFVKTVVAKNFDDVVNDETKDVLIEFYAPWCGHCKSLAPKYEELAEKLKDEPSVVIAKMDATANDVPPQYDVRGFPTIYFAPKGSKDSPKRYEGGREVDDFVKYLARESTDGLQNVPQDADKKKKKKKNKKVEL